MLPWKRHHKNNELTVSKQEHAMHDPRNRGRSHVVVVEWSVLQFPVLTFDS